MCAGKAFGDRDVYQKKCSKGDLEILHLSNRQRHYQERPPDWKSVLNYGQQERREDR